MEEYFEYIKNNKNNLSYWFPKVKDCGIPVPETIIVEVPIEVQKAFHEGASYEDVVYDFVKNTLMPAIPTDWVFLFIKNGCFSDKFSFNHCKNIRDKYLITFNLMNLNYNALMLGAGGISEVVVRKFVGEWSGRMQPTIYQGMPLRPEYRVFYDFDSRKVLYSANYWNRDYCYDAISQDTTDKYVYEKAYPIIADHFAVHKDEVERMVEEAMKNVNLEGKWSVDIMYCIEEGQYYLIDMALAEQSAYWRKDYE